MTILDSIAPSAAQHAAATKKAPTELGVNDFLKLMTTQLKNQDPLKPLDSTAFVSQLAQFGTVSGIQQMQASIGSLADSLRSSQTLSGASLVGHSVLAPASAAMMNAGDTVRGAIDVPEGASALQITVTDASGQPVRHITLGPQSGLTDFSWDGLTDTGAPVASGAYSFQAIANVGGTHQSASTLLVGQVASVTMDAKGASLTLNTNALGPLALNNVRRVM